MKQLLPALRTLWQNAPLWRGCVSLTVISLAMASFFPTDGLKKRAPWLPGTSPVTAHSGSNTPNGQLPPSSVNPEKDTAAHRPPVQLQYPDLTDTVEGHITLGSHTLPLPQGTWHPVLAARIDDSSPFSFLALIRTDQGVVTGILVTQATQQPITLDQIAAETDVCHDDRNYLNSIIPPAQAVEDCAALRLITLHGPAPSDSPFTNEAMARLRVMGFPIPPLFITAQWRHIEATRDGRAQAGTVDFLVPPLDAQTHQLLAPLPAWPRDVLHNHPAANSFVTRMKTWLPQWQAALKSGFEEQLDEISFPVAALRDPMAPSQQHP